MSDQMKWGITAEDVAKNKLAEPGWHNFEIIDFAVEVNKKKDANNAVFLFKICEGSFTGVEIKVWFSEKVPAMMLPLLLALDPSCENPDGTVSATLTKPALMGKKFRGLVQRGTWNNKPKNEISEYAPL